MKRRFIKLFVFTCLLGVGYQSMLYPFFGKKKKKKKKKQTTHQVRQKKEKAGKAAQVGPKKPSKLKVLFNTMLQRMKVLFAYITKSLLGSLIQNIQQAPYLDKNGKKVTQVSILQRITLKDAFNLAKVAATGRQPLPPGLGGQQSTTGAGVGKKVETKVKAQLEKAGVKPIGIIFEMSPDKGKGFAGLSVKPVVGPIDGILDRIKGAFKIDVKNIANKILFAALRPFVAGKITEEKGVAVLRTSPFIEFLFQTGLLVSNMVQNRVDSEKFLVEIDLLVRRLTQTEGFKTPDQIFKKVPFPFQPFLSIKIKKVSIRRALTVYINIVKEGKGDTFDQILDRLMGTKDDLEGVDPLLGEEEGFDFEGEGADVNLDFLGEMSEDDALFGDFGDDFGDILETETPAGELSDDFVDDALKDLGVDSSEVDLNILKDVDFVPEKPKVDKDVKYEEEDELKGVKTPEDLAIEKALIGEIRKLIDDKKSLELIKKINLLNKDMVDLMGKLKFVSKEQWDLIGRGKKYQSHYARAQAMIKLMGEAKRKSYYAEPKMALIRKEADSLTDLLLRSFKEGASVEKRKEVVRRRVLKDIAAQMKDWKLDADKGSIRDVVIYFLESFNPANDFINKIIDEEIKKIIDDKKNVALIKEINAFKKKKGSKDFTVIKKDKEKAINAIVGPIKEKVTALKKVFTKRFLDKVTMKIRSRVVQTDPNKIDIKDLIIDFLKDFDSSKKEETKKKEPKKEKTAVKTAKPPAAPDISGLGKKKKEVPKKATKEKAKAPAKKATGKKKK